MLHLPHQYECAAYAHPCANGLKNCGNHTLSCLSSVSWNSGISAPISRLPVPAPPMPFFSSVAWLLPLNPPQTCSWPDGRCSYPTAFQPVQHGQPVLGASVIPHTDGQHFFPPFRIDAGNGIGCQFPDHTVITGRIVDGANGISFLVIVFRL